MERGAVLVMGLFAGLFLAGLLYHVAGVGHAAVEHQLMQEAADSVAWSAATAKARGMNTIALINLVMATVLAVLVAIRLLQMVIAAAMVAVGVACIFTGGAACGAIAPLTQVQIKLGTLAKDLEQPVRRVLEGLEDAADAVNRAAPILAQADAVYVSRKEGRGVCTVGFAWPVVDELPTVKGRFEDLCDQAGRQVASVSTFFLPGDLPAAANDVVGDLIGGMASSFSAWFCGGSSDPPALAARQDVAYPIALDASCDAASARPSSVGACATERCRQCAAQGCSACLSRIGRDGYREGQWQVQEEEWEERETATGVWSKHGYQRRERLRNLSDDPCDGQGICGTDEVCVKEERVMLPGTVGAVRVMKTTWVTLHSCVVKEQQPPQETPDAMDSSDWPVHREVDADATENDFRVLSVTAGRNRGAVRSERIAVPTGAGRGSGFGARMGFAAAQFTSVEGDLWHMDWYSRLVRVRTKDADETGGNCGGAFATECSQLSGGLSQLKELETYVIH